VKKVVVVLALLLAPSLAAGHPAPFSYLDLRIESDGIDGTLVVHMSEIKHNVPLDDAIFKKPGF
jgi:hypothetical protein